MTTARPVAGGGEAVGDGVRHGAGVGAEVAREEGLGVVVHGA